LEEALRQALDKIAHLEQRVNELEARLNRNSSNSSQPPSQDPPQAPKKTKREKSGRTPGGQPGHQGNHRQLVPPEKVDKIIEYRSEACPHCHNALQESNGEKPPSLERHQVWELPEICPRSQNIDWWLVGVPVVRSG
jgi:transposase